MNRSEILDTAKEYVTKDRAADHGDMEDNFSRIAGLWTSYLGVDVSAVDVAAMMSLMKIARIKGNPRHLDSWTDVCGYASLGGELAEKI